MIAPVERAWRAACRRDAAIAIGLALPWITAATALALRLGEVRDAVLAAGALGTGLLLWIARRWRERDLLWLRRALDAARPDLEDSADLLTSDAAGTTVQRLQRGRLAARLAARPPDLRQPWPIGALTLSVTLGLAATLAILFFPQARFEPAAVEAPPIAPPETRMPALLQSRVSVTPPAYTGLPMRTEPTLSLRAPEGSRLRWHLRFSTAPATVELALLDGRRVPLARESDAWEGELVLDRPTLYRIQADGVPLEESPERLDASTDHPPQLRVLAPGRSLSLAAPGQRRWALDFEASDDYALADFATLRITRTQGTGENIAVAERSLRLRGEGAIAARRYRHLIDLVALAPAPGDDLIVQLAVRDTRAPQPQETRSPSLILRWPPEAAPEGGDLEGAVQRVMPAYFRSQRQIILDAEALLRERSRLDANAFAQRSDALGVDQRILRLRYGQFLGEEAEDASAADHAQDDHAAEEEPAAFGQDMDLIAEFGHTHDIPEAATLLDPRTREVLRKALGQMWQSELGLRQGDPRAALPHAYRALDYIKQVQQADRIYLPRLGSDLPPIDEGRRLGGKREGIASRPDPLRRAQREGADFSALWSALGEPDSPLDAAALDALRAASDDAPDPLALQETLDAVLRQPDCGECRDALRARLWPLLGVPATTVPRRARVGETGARYLDALREKATP